MTNATRPAPPKWIATIAPVGEITIYGTADAGYWTDRLAGLGMRPVTSDGLAQLLISSVTARFRGWPFRELSLSVAAAPRSSAASARQTSQDATGYWLGQAFHSSRVLAWCERVFFQTPYDLAEIELNLTRPYRLAVAQRGKPLLLAELGAAPGGEVSSPLRSGWEVWEGPIYLADRSAAPSAPARWFAARLEGEAQVFAVQPPSDRVELHEHAAWPLLAEFRRSGFQAREWLLRPAGRHRRSKTLPGVPSR